VPLSIAARDEARQARKRSNGRRSLRLQTCRRAIDVTYYVFFSAFRQGRLWLTLLEDFHEILGRKS